VGSGSGSRHTSFHGSKICGQVLEVVRQVLVDLAAEVAERSIGEGLPSIISSSLAKNLAYCVLSTAFIGVQVVR
jgi:hypothetical protein